MEEDESRDKGDRRSMQNSNLAEGEPQDERSGKEDSRTFEHTRVWYRARTQLGAEAYSTLPGIIRTLDLCQ